MPCHFCLATITAVSREIGSGEDNEAHPLKPLLHIKNIEGYYCYPIRLVQIPAWYRLSKLNLVTLTIKCLL